MIATAKCRVDLVWLVAKRMFVNDVVQTWAALFEPHVRPLVDAATLALAKART